MSTFEKIKETAVNTIDDMAEDVKYAYDKVENAVVGKFEDISDAFVEKHLMKDGETLEEAKERLAKENAERMDKQKEMIEKSIEASKNAGKR